MGDASEKIEPGTVVSTTVPVSILAVKCAIQVVDSNGALGGADGGNGLTPRSFISINRF
jgi:hypothetical protein